MVFIRNIYLVIFISLASACLGQNKTIKGIVTDSNNQAIELVSIKVAEINKGTSTNKSGEFQIIVPPKSEYTIIFSHINFKEFRLTYKATDKLPLRIRLIKKKTNLETVEVKSQKDRHTTITRIDAELSKKALSISGGIEDLIKTLPGVSSNNELSTQYSVRGGNYDENLIYVNGIEIYRPFLIRSGQQEGLSFLNSDMVSSIAFSSGGFEAIYGDKMSSVLDIKYKKPKEFGTSISLGLLNNQLYIQNLSKNKRFSYLAGFRHKTNSSLLGSLDTKGDYQPNFYDIQTFLTYQLNNKLELSFFGNYANNRYKLVPSNRETSFGTFNEAYKFKIYFDGQELDQFETLFGAFSLNYIPNHKTKITYTVSVFQTDERETYDIQGQYWIGRIEPLSNPDDLNDPIELQGIGTHLNHARNYLKAVVYNTELKGKHILKSQIIDWGIKYQYEDVRDNISEWELIDSASYSVPSEKIEPGKLNPNQNDLVLFHSIKAKNKLISNRISGYLQGKFALTNKLFLTGGFRLNYWDFNAQMLFSPRASLSYKPDWKSDIIFKFASGVYYQPPFYKELRNTDGSIVDKLKAQKSIHFVGGLDWNLKIWNRLFRLNADIYYKHLSNLVPYKIDNVRISYLPQLKSKGYATGLDFKLNGEFVEGIESWLSLSFLKTQEDIEGDFRTINYNAAGEIIIPGYTKDDVIVRTVQQEIGYIPRPTDQRFNFSLFFQDYLPNNPTYKVHLKMTYGSRLPFGPPNAEKYKDVLRIPPYRRVDIGFSKEITRKRSSNSPKRSLKNFKSIWITAEVLNLFQIDNTVSYLWIKDISNRQYAVPNYLTSRQLNIRLIATF